MFKCLKTKNVYLKIICILLKIDWNFGHLFFICCFDQLQIILCQKYMNENKKKMKIKYPSMIISIHLKTEMWNFVVKWNQIYKYWEIWQISFN